MDLKFENLRIGIYCSSDQYMKVEVTTQANDYSEGQCQFTSRAVTNTPFFQF